MALETEAQEGRETYPGLHSWESQFRWENWKCREVNRQSVEEDTKEPGLSISERRKGKGRKTRSEWKWGCKTHQPWGKYDSGDEAGPARGARLWTFPMTRWELGFWRRQWHGEKQVKKMKLVSENGWLQQEGNKPDGDYNGSWLQYYSEHRPGIRQINGWVLVLPLDISVTPPNPHATSPSPVKLASLPPYRLFRGERSLSRTWHKINFSLFWVGSRWWGLELV